MEILLPKTTIHQSLSRDHQNLFYYNYHLELICNHLYCSFSIFVKYNVFKYSIQNNCILFPRLTFYTSILFTQFCYKFDDLCIVTGFLRTCLYTRTIFRACFITLDSCNNKINITYVVIPLWKIIQCFIQNQA